MNQHTEVIYALYYGKSVTPLVHVIPDATYPGMWRIQMPDGQHSDMVNLARAKDAALTWGQRNTPSKRTRMFVWKKEVASDARRPVADASKRGGPYDASEEARIASARRATRLPRVPVKIPKKHRVSTCMIQEGGQIA